MTIGEKIKKFRKLFGWSQRELGERMGFPATSKDTKIRKYELGLIKPKQAAIEKFSEILDVDISALTETSVSSPEMVLQTLFDLEEQYNLQIERKDNETHFIIKDSISDNEVIASYLYAWYQRKERLSNKDDTKSLPLEERDRYTLWKGQFPREIRNYLEKQETLIDNYFKPHLKKLSKRKRIINLSEFSADFRELAKTNLNIEIKSKTFAFLDNSLVFTFYVNELLAKGNDKKDEAFAKFLKDLMDFEKYHVEIDRKLYTLESGTKVSYYIPLNPLAGSRYKSFIENVLDFERNKGTKTDYEKEVFENDYKLFSFTGEDNIEKIVKDNIDGRKIAQKMSNM